MAIEEMEEIKDFSWEDLFKRGIIKIQDAMAEGDIEKARACVDLQRALLVERRRKDTEFDSKIKKKFGELEKELGLANKERLVREKTFYLFEELILLMRKDVPIEIQGRRRLGG